MNKDIGDRWHIESTQDQIWVHLRDIEAAGHQLIEVKPGLSLEAAFFAAIGQPMERQSETKSGAI
jgi:ABC-2 type transport system ATP-binding protein